MKTKLLHLFVSGIVLTSLAYLLINSYQEKFDLDELRKNANNLRYIDLSGGSTRIVRIENEDQRRVLLLHGGGSAGSEIWQSNIAFLMQQDIDILTYDQYGKGYSDRPKMTYSLDNLSQQLNEILDKTNFSSQKLSIVSHSLGGMLATRYMVNNSDKVDKVILISPNLLGGFKPKSVLKVPLISELLLTFYWYWGFLDGREKEFYDKKKFKDYAELITPFSQTEGFKYVYHRTWLDILTEDVKQELRLISAKTQQNILIVYGMDDPYFNERTVDDLKKFLPQANYILVDSVGHNINFEKPDAINQIIHNFIISGP